LIIPHSFPSIDKRDSKDIISLIDESYVGNKSNLNEILIKKINQFVNSDKTYITQSGSQSILIALKNFGIKEGDKVALCSINCPSVINVLRFLNLVPVFYDVRNTCDFRPSQENIEIVLNEHKPKVVIITHCFGVLVEKNIFHFISNNYRCKIIEDYSTSFPSSYSDNSKVGEYSDGVIGSFGSTKPITGGIGGFLSLRKSRFKSSYDCLHREQDIISLNTNISSINQCLILNQFDKIDEIATIKKKIIKFYCKYTSIWKHDCSLFRAITFRSSELVEKTIESYGYKLDTRECLHPYISCTYMSNASRFNKYKSLPLNIKMYNFLNHNNLL
jgi:dTDP-4-amino-4,6-dideoxygalactose transaminase